jgi:hypothetical protein
MQWQPTDDYWAYAKEAGDALYYLWTPAPRLAPEDGWQLWNRSHGYPWSQRDGMGNCTFWTPSDVPAGWTPIPGAHFLADCYTWQRYDTYDTAYFRPLTFNGLADPDDWTGPVRVAPPVPNPTPAEAEEAVGPWIDPSALGHLGPWIDGVLGGGDATLGLEQQMQTQNPGLDAGTIHAVARECVDMTSGLPGGSANCLNLPIFATGSDVPEATQHDRDAIAGDQGHPAWVQLNYEPSGGKDTHWKDSKDACQPSEAPEKNCDEYPFLASMQGYPASPQPHLRKINAAQNQLQGSFYSGFLLQCGLRTPGTPSGAPFLVIPLPAGSNIPTTSICNVP